MTQLQVVALLVAVVVLVLTVETLRRRQMKEKYTVLWLMVTVAIVVLAAWPPLLDTVAGWLGVADPPNLLAFAAMLFLLGVTAHLSWETSRLEEKTRILAEEVALLRQQLEDADRGD